MIIIMRRRRHDDHRNQPPLCVFHAEGRFPFEGDVLRADVRGLLFIHKRRVMYNCGNHVLYVIGVRMFHAHYLCDINSCYQGEKLGNINRSSN